MNPRAIEELGNAMGEVYEAVVNRILINLAHHFPMIAEGTKDIEGAWSYQVTKLAEMGQVNRETEQIILSMLQDADEALQTVLENAIIDGLKDAEKPLRDAAEKGLINGGIVPPMLAPNQMQAFQSYYRQSADKLNLVNTVMLESTRQAYQATVSDIVAKMEKTQSILNVATGEVVTGVTAMNSAVRSAVKKMVENGITGYIDHAGRHWSPEGYVTMDIRTTTANAARDAVTERMNQYGSDLYQVSWHDGARPLCYPWQGKVISRTGQSGETEDGQGNKVRVYAESETSKGEPAGLYGINCGHYPIPFFPGYSRIRPPAQNEEENAKEYELSQKQRALERKLRNEKRDLAVLKAQGASEEEIAAQRERVRAADTKLDDFSSATGRARRKSREYTPIKPTFPDKDTYDPKLFDNSQKDEIQSFFRNGGDDPPVSYTLKDATVTKETYTVNAGTGSEIPLKSANVYTMPDGTRFVFKTGMNKEHQKATPDFVIEQWYKTPAKLREMAQKEIAVVDRYNPADEYWRKKYKGFKHAYATGGDTITFYRYDHSHSPQYFVRSITHEMGHKIDRSIGNGPLRFSESGRWEQAMAADLVTSGKHSITQYGENSPREDFAESIAEYIANKEKFTQTMPERAKLIEQIIAGVITGG